MEKNSNYKASDMKIYNELDDFAAEVLNGEELIKYMGARREYFLSQEEAVSKYFSSGEVKEKISTYGDFYYHYLAEYSRGYMYKIGNTGYTEGFREMLQKYELDPDIIDVNWENVKEKEEIYETDLSDILFAMISYEIGKHGFVIFGINMGFESTIYFIVNEKAYSSRIKKNYDFITLFDLEFLENVYNEIYEVTEDIGDKKVRIGDFLEKKNNKYYTMFRNREANTVIENLNSDNDEKLKLIL